MKECVRNEYIQGSVGAATFEDKVIENRLRRYEYTEKRIDVLVKK